MSGIVGDIKKLFKFKFKSRSDGITDQFHRLFMTRALIVAAFLTGMNWYKDDIKCIVPKSFGGSVDSFGPKSCWINGFYVFKELKDLQNFNGYYGLPDHMAHNGTLTDIAAAERSNGGGLRTCVATESSSKVCKPMEKMFYLQYQWFPFYLAALALLYYLPYIMFQFVNTDILAFKKDIQNQKADVDAIVKTYFNSETNLRSRQTMRVFLNILVKFAYIIANVCVFQFTDTLLNNEFVQFGSNWLDWSKLTNEQAHNYVGLRKNIKAGERLLPTFGFCDVLEASQDIKIHLVNEYSLVCEISQHVLYHYVLFAVWVLIVAGFVVSAIGFLLLIFKHVMRSHFFANEEVAARRVYNSLTTREGEYLDFARKKNVPVYGSLIRALHSAKFEDEDDYIPKPKSDYTKDSEF